MSDELVIYHADGLTGEFIGSGYADPDPLEPGIWLIPARAYREKPPEPGPKEAAVRSAEGWELVADHRGVVYRTEDGAAVLHNALGELPYGLTSVAWPGLDYTWVNGEWLLDEDARTIRNQVEARLWRDNEIERVKWLRERHRDELDLGHPHTLTAEQFRDLLAYMQALRDWPQSDGFPAQENRPVGPQWVSGLPQ